MGLAQTFLTIASIALLGIISLTLNTSYLNSNQTMVESEYTIEAVSLAESYLERAIGESFDQQTIYAAVSSTSSLSTTLGPEAGETNINLFNDFDDYNGYTTTATTQRATYNVSISVVYVADTNPSVTSGSKTWHKKMTVTVSNSYMTVPVTMNYIYSYF
ncbi:MAG: hypothetical protein Q8903_03355 [Bacteroidota bacterium]|nr:hypothetical protein [Bacteroidota bacterium]